MIQSEARVLGSNAPGPGPVDLFLIHPYSLAMDDSRYYELLPYPPLGLLMVAAVAREMGYSVLIYDGTFSDGLGDLADCLRRSTPRVIGIGSWSSYRANTHRILQKVAGEGVPVVAGGPDPSIYPDDYLAAGADMVVVGEGETTLKGLLPALLGGPDPSGRPALWEPDVLRRIPGVVFKESRSADLDVVRTSVRARIDDLEALPLPAYDLVPVDLYLKAWEEKFGFTSLPLMTARGCPFQCTWCARPSFGKVYKQRSVAHVMKELHYLVETLGVRYLRVVDDTFVIRRSWIQEWSQAVAKSGLDLRYECLARVELLGDSVVQALSDSGCVKVFCGVESGSQRVLDAMKKGTTVEQIRAAGRRLKGAGIQFHSYLMFGYPGERHHDVRLTMRLLQELQPEEYSISIAYPMPGTEFYDLVHAFMQARGWKNRDDGELQFKGAYSPFYYRLARAITRRLYAPGHPRNLREAVTGWMMEVLFLLVRWRDEHLQRRDGRFVPDGTNG